MRVRFAVVIALALLVAACSGGDDSSADDATTTAAAEVVVTTTTTQGIASSTTAGETPPDFSGPSLITEESAITTAGLGVIRIGMTPDEAEKAANDRQLRRDGGSDACYVSVLERSPGSISFIFSNGVFATVVVDDQSVATSSGARVGDSEQQILDLFGDKIVATDIPTGRNLTFVPSDPGFENDRVVFRTDGTAVVQIRAGTLPEVGAENGCLDLE
ncbi:MAG: hypothetical protein ACC652_04225 [Acidimicrobiales bacterium]